MARPAVFRAEAGSASGIAGRAEEWAAGAALAAAGDDVHVRGGLVRRTVERAAVDSVAEEAAGAAAGVGALAIDHVNVRGLLVRGAEERHAVRRAAEARAARAAVCMLAALAAHVDEALARVRGAEERDKVDRTPEVGQPLAPRMPAPPRHHIDVPRFSVAGAHVGGACAGAGWPEERPLAAIGMSASEGAAVCTSRGCASAPSVVFSLSASLTANVSG